MHEIVFFSIRLRCSQGKLMRCLSCINKLFKLIQNYFQLLKIAEAQMSMRRHRPRVLHINHPLQIVGNNNEV
jgi:hypothetical protein